MFIRWGDIMNFAFIDPGIKTGIAIWSDDNISGSFEQSGKMPIMCRLVNVGTVKFDTTDNYKARLKAIKHAHQVAFAVIEQYQNFGRRFANAGKVLVQECICCEVWPEHILVPKNTWDSGRTKPKMQRMIIEEANIECPANEHERDSLHMGLNIWRRLPVDNLLKADYLFRRALEEKTIGKLL